MITAALLLAHLQSVDVSARLDLGKAPHQIVFRPDGSSALAAVMGSDVVVEVDATSREVIASWNVTEGPIGVALPDPSGAPFVTRFGTSSLTAFGASQPEELVLGGDGPSYLTPTTEGRYLVSLERANEMVVVDPARFAVSERYSVGERPFPPAVTSDGRLAFVPNYDAGSVTPIDLWNGRVYDPVSVGANPSGGTVLPGDVDVAIAVRGENKIAFVNTASRTVVGELTEGIGGSPFDVVVAPNGRIAFVNNTASHDVSVFDVRERRVIGRLETGEAPIGMAVSPDGRELWVSCEFTHEVVIFELPPAWAAPAVEPARPVDPTPVAVLGMIHGSHRTSERWGLDEVREAIRRFRPDVVLTEIPPDRWDRIARDWKERGALEDDRIRVFPEYTDVLLPLWNEMDFEIVPCAAWTREMNDQRRARIAKFESDPAHAAEAAAYAEASARANAEQLEGPSDDPVLIHSEAYDEWYRRRTAPYDSYLNDFIGFGGWTNINRGHMALIHRGIDANPGKRVLITFGAGHKHWFLDDLARRDDVRLVDVTPYLPTAEAGVDETARDDIRSLHQFFQDWFDGTLENTDEAFSRFADAMDENFELVGTDGGLSSRSDLIARLRSAHGFRSTDPLRIWTRNESTRPAGDGLLVATYEEWQALPVGDPVGRLSTALLRRDSSAPGGFVWLHVHETWMEGHAPR